MALELTFIAEDGAEEGGEEEAGGEGGREGGERRDGEGRRGVRLSLSMSLFLSFLLCPSAVVFSVLPVFLPATPSWNLSVL
jgi:hypothetical protein